MTHQFDNVGSEGTAAPSHSPAPWDVSDSLMVTDANADECAMPCGRTDAIVEANARLIASAPDLLAALERMTADEPIEHNPDDGSACFFCRKEWSHTRAHLGQVACLHSSDCEWLQARAAIARAKGE